MGLLTVVFESSTSTYEESVWATLASRSNWGKNPGQDTEHAQIWHPRQAGELHTCIWEGGRPPKRGFTHAWHTPRNVKAVAVATTEQQKNKILSIWGWTVWFSVKCDATQCYNKLHHAKTHWGGRNKRKTGMMWQKKPSCSHDESMLSELKCVLLCMRKQKHKIFPKIK